MKARKEDNGQIKIYGTPPSKWKGVKGNYAGGFHLADEDTLKEEGFFDVLTPEYNKTIEDLSEIYFDEVNQIFTYNILPKLNLPTIEEAKISKVKELKYRAKEKFNETDWYYIRELHNTKKGKSKKVPELIVGEREVIYSLIELREAEIDSLTELEDVLNFDTSLEEKVEIEEIIPEELIVEEPVVEEPAVEIPVEEPVIEEPVVEVPVVEEPVVETPAEEPVIVVPIIDEPVVDKPATVPIPDIFLEDPVIEAPAVETPFEVPSIEIPVSNSTPIPEPSIEQAELNQFTV